MGCDHAKHISRPGIIGVPLSAQTDLEIMLVANLISLTPGTLSIDMSEDKKLYVHVMFLDNVERHVGPSRRARKKSFGGYALMPVVTSFGLPADSPC